MDAVMMIERANSMGLQLAVVDNRLSVTGKQTAEAAALVRQISPMRADIIALLNAPEPVSDIFFDLANIAVLPIDPAPAIRIVSACPALPREMWLAGLSPSEALTAHRRLRAEYFCSCGKDGVGWYVRCDPAHYEVVAYGVDVEQ